MKTKIFVDPDTGDLLVDLDPDLLDEVDIDIELPISITVGTSKKQGPVLIISQD